MPRIAGVDVPNEKAIWTALTYIYGIGVTTSYRVLNEAKVEPTRRARDLSEDELARIASVIGRTCETEGQLRRKIQQDISRLKRMGSYRGIRHARGLPVRGQRTRTNSRTRKGKKKTVAGKKSVREMK